MSLKSARIVSWRLVLLNGKITKQFGKANLDPSYEPSSTTCSRPVPLSLLSVGQSGKVNIDQSALLSQKEQTFAIDTTTPFKLNAGPTGPCEDS